MDAQESVLRTEGGDVEARVLAFLALVREMRTLQRLFFSTHSQDVLLRSKAAERAVDKAEAELRAWITVGEQGELF